MTPPDVMPREAYIKQVQCIQSVPELWNEKSLFMHSVDAHSEYLNQEWGRAIKSPATLQREAELAAQSISSEFAWESTAKVYNGSIIRIHDGMAFVVIRSNDGETLEGEIPFKDLQSNGISEDGYFECEIIGEGADAAFKCSPAPFPSFSDEDVAEIEETLRLDLTEYDLRDDY